MRIRVASQAGRMVAAATTTTVPIGISASDHQGAMTASSVVPLAILQRARYSPMPSGMATRDASAATAAWELTTVETIRASDSGQHHLAARQFNRWSWGMRLILLLLVVAAWDMVFKPGF